METKNGANGEVNVGLHLVVHNFTNAYLGQYLVVCVNRKPFANTPTASPIKGDNMSAYFCSSRWSNDMNEHDRPSSDRQPERSKPTSTCSSWIWICLSNATLMLRCGIFSGLFVFLVWQCTKNIKAWAMLCLQETLGCFCLLLPFWS